MTRAALLLALVGALVACSGGGAPRPVGTKPPAVRILGRNLVLLPGRTDAVRLGFEAAEPTAEFIATFRPDTARVSVCPLPSVDAPLPAARACEADVRSGVRDRVSGDGMRALALVLDGPQRVPLDLLVEFGERGRRVAARLPLLPPPRAGCAGNACSAFFEVQPPRGGPFDATARWEGPAATLVLLQGPVLAGSERAIGTPYREAARADGAGPLRIGARISGDEHALELRAATRAAGALRAVAIDAGWP